MQTRHRQKQEAAAPLVRFDPRSDAQRAAQRAAEEADVVFLVGGPGVGKTAAAVGLALLHAVPQGERVSVCRPAVEASAGIGWLKGTLHDKYGVWAAPVVDCAEKFILGGAGQHLDFCPMAYLQGRTLRYAVLDEAQNCTVDELEMFLTRLGKGGKFFVAGDPTQSVIGERSGLVPWANALAGLPRVASVTFPPGQSMRSPLVEAIVRRRPR